MKLIPFVYAPMSLKGECIAQYKDEAHPIPQPDAVWGDAELPRNDHYGQIIQDGSLLSCGRFLYKLHDVVVVPDVFEKGVYHIALEKGVLAQEARTGKGHSSNGGLHFNMSLPESEPVPINLMADYEIAHHEHEPHVFYLCGWNGNYAHRVLDTLPRGWAEDEGLIPAGTKWAPQTDVAIRYDTLWFPSFWPAAGYAPGPVEWLKTRAPKQRMDQGNFVWVIDREDAKTRRVLNIDDVLDTLGYSGLQPFQIDMKGGRDIQEQIGYAQQSRIIIGPHGAGMVNAIFANDATVIELVPQSYQHPLYQYTSKWAGNRYYRVICPDGENQDMIVDINALRQMLERACDR